MDRNKHSVLIIEDHEASRETLAKLLMFSLDGWEVLTAATIAQGLSLLEREPDCIVLDLMLPDGDGETVLRRVRDGKLRSRVAVTTGTGDEARLAQVQQLQPEAVLQKPVDLGAIFQVCQTAVA